jgi:hypothetical protein
VLDVPRKAEPETQAREIQAPETHAPEASAPEAPAPETPAPEAHASETPALEIRAQETQAAIQIAHLQKDGLLLLAHLAENSNRSLVAGTGRPEDQVDPGMLTAPPAEIAADDAKFRRLLRTIDALAIAAAPATTTSIRLTCAYLSGPSSQVSQADVARAANLRRWLNGIRLALLAAVLLSVALLMHVDDGRRVIGQMAAVRTDLDRTYGDLAKLDRALDFDLEIFFAPGATQPVPKPEKGTLEFCWPLDPATLRVPNPAAAGGASPAAAPRTGEWRLVPVKVPSQNLCSQLFQHQLREAMVFARLEAWNCRMTTLAALVNPVALARTAFVDICEDRPIGLSPPASPEHWKRTELRANDGIARLTGYVLPLLLGGIGGCVFVLRQFDARLRSFTLSANDGVSSAARVILASTFGGLLGLVFGTDGPVLLGGFSLQLAAWAFFLGYSLETVLKTLDALIDGVVGRLKPGGEPKKEVPIAPAPSRSGA